VPSVHLTTRRVRSDLIETFKIIHEIDKVDKKLFFEFDSGGSRWGPVGYLVIPGLGLGLGIDNLKNIKKYLIGGAANTLDIPCPQTPVK